MRQVRVFQWIDGPPEMHMDLGWNWQLIDENGKVLAECPNGFKNHTECLANALATFPAVQVVEIGKFNPDSPLEYVNGVYNKTYNRMGS